MHGTSIHSKLESHNWIHLFVEFETLKGIIRAWQNKPWPIYKLVQTVQTLFFKDADLVMWYREDLKKPIYFYYSNCYYSFNKVNAHRIHKKRQVRYKRTPRVEPAMRLPKPGTGMYVLYSASARSVFLYHVLVLAGPRRLNKVRLRVLVILPTYSTFHSPLSITSCDSCPQPCNFPKFDRNPLMPSEFLLVL